MTASTTSGSQDGRYHRLAWWTLAIALICGGILRSVWIEDMEWKDDERWSYRMSQEVGRTRLWPSVGMPTSLGFPNPGLSVWMFVAIGRMAHTPTSMARVLVLLNMNGLVGFAGVVCAYFPFRQREPWIWGLAQQAVSPFSIRLSRKIWPPSTLTPFLLLLWISHQHRQPSGPLGSLYVGTGRCGDRPGAPERLVCGDELGPRHRGRRMPEQPAQVALLALVAFRQCSGPDQYPPPGYAPCPGRPSPCPQDSPRSRS